MPRQTHTNFMRATIWPPTIKIESEGTPAGVISTAFHALANRPKARAALLEELRVLDANFTQHEADNPDQSHEKDTTK